MAEHAELAGRAHPRLALLRLRFPAHSQPQRSAALSRAAMIGALGYGDMDWLIENECAHVAEGFELRAVLEQDCPRELDCQPIDRAVLGAVRPFSMLVASLTHCAAKSMNAFLIIGSLDSAANSLQRRARVRHSLGSADMSLSLPATTVISLSCSALNLQRGASGATELQITLLELL
jgi:hypothetical protein